MKNILFAIIITGALTAGLVAKAADKGKGAEEKKALLEKYDANKDGKIDKEEQSKMSEEDKAKWAKLSGGKKKKN